MTKIIAVANQKGGVGKTTTTLNLAHALAEDGQNRVLLCDLDPQASLTALLGFEVHTLPASVYDLLLEKPGLKPEDVVLATQMAGVSLLPSTIDLSKAESELLAETGRDHLLAGVLAPLHDRFEFILCDCPPSLGLLTSNVLAAADEVLIPLSSDYLALRALEHLLANVEKIRRRVNPRLKTGGILVTMHHQRTAHARAILDGLRSSHPELVFESVIPYSVRAKDSIATGQSVLAYDPKGPLAEAYRSVAREIANHA
jgi:chromosome partitioning protein